jgi:hypothetical protein
MRREPIIVEPERKEFFVEVLSDDAAHGIIVARFGRFDPALRAYETLIADKPLMRVVMRKMAHMYRNYIPARLHNSYDRSREYPM